jgi:ribosomal protein S18 acetylase RimI-like enzyme
MEVGFAAPDDADAILDIVSRTLPAPVLACTPLGGAKACAYLTALIEHRRTGADRVWTVMRTDEDAVVGFIEIRLAIEDLFINHIHIRPEWQGHGIGSRLLRESLEMLNSPSIQRLELDVFVPENLRAYDWYSRLGFTPLHRSAWMMTPLPPGNTLSRFHIRGLAQALCLQAEYGFSQFTVQTEQGVYEVGRLGESLFRVSEPYLLADPGALAALHQIAPASRLLIIGKEALFGTNPAPLQTLATSVRMAAEFGAVRSYLSIIPRKTIC